MDGPVYCDGREEVRGHYVRWKIIWMDPCTVMAEGKLGVTMYGGRLYGWTRVL